MRLPARQAPQIFTNLLTNFLARIGSALSSGRKRQTSVSNSRDSSPEDASFHCTKLGEGSWCTLALFFFLLQGTGHLFHLFQHVCMWISTLNMNFLSNCLSSEGEQTRIEVSLPLRYHSNVFSKDGCNCTKNIRSVDDSNMVLPNWNWL